VRAPDGDCPAFALIGVAGYIARRHLEAIRDVGGTLIACHDITDSVGILDSYFPDARFFTSGAAFEGFLSQPRNRPDYLVVCTPNDLHAAHATLGVRLGADVILEKPPALNTSELDSLIALQAASGHAIHPVLQLRYHDGLCQFRDLMARRDPSLPAAVTVRYVTRRGAWFGVSWKGDPARSGSIIFNIGIHLFDALTWALGSQAEIAHARIAPTGDHADGRLRFGAVTVDWTLSTRASDLPAGTPAQAARNIALDGQLACDFSDYSALHTVLYQEVVAGRGPRIEDATAATRLAEQIRAAASQHAPPLPEPRASTGRLASR
jgi:UDP-N-acetyl-2-amino-2-deoxyglucuronate dehydrogenase